MRKTEAVAVRRQMTSLVKEWTRSGQTGKTFAARNGITAAKSFYWKLRLSARKGLEGSERIDSLALVKDVVSGAPRPPRRSFGLESGLEHGVELVECGLHVCRDGSPLSVFERGDRDTELDLGALLGLKVAAAVAPEDLELAVGRLDGVGRAKSTPDAIRVVEKGEVVGSLLA